MISGVFFVIAACMCWGLIFVVPKYISGFSPIEISLGRYLCFGLISSAFLLFNKRHLLNKNFIPAWKSALWLSLLSTLISYTGVLFCIHYANAAVAALIFGMSPITIALYGNWFKREFPFRSFLIPIFLMLIGIVLVNLDAFHLGHTSPLLYSIGLISGVLGLAAWTWYTVANFDFMEKNKHISANDWVIMTGAATLPLTLIAAAIGLCFFPNALHAYFTWSEELKSFLVGSFILGAISSWVAYLLWMCGNLRLPISLAGQLTIFEMIFGLFFVYLSDLRCPLIFEIIGISIMITGVLFAFKMERRAVDKRP